MFRSNIRYLGTIMLMIMIFMMGMSMALNCTVQNTQGGSCIIYKPNSGGCTTEHQDDDLTSTCSDILMSDVPYIGAFDKTCSKCNQYSDNLATGPPTILELNVIPYNHDYFLLNVSWNSVHGAGGYRVNIETLAFSPTEHNPPDTSGCHCVNANKTHEVFVMEYSYPLDYSTCQQIRYFQVKITTYPRPTSKILFISKSHYWPTNCYNFSDSLNALQSICGPALPGKPQNFKFTRQVLVYPVMAVHIQWDHPLYTIEQYKPMEYYLDYYHTGDYYMQPFHVLNATSVIIQPLYMNLNYHFSLTAFQAHVCNNPYCTSIFPCGFGASWIISSISIIKSSTISSQPTSTSIHDDTTSVMFSSTVIFSSSQVIQHTSTPTVRIKAQEKDDKSITLSAVITGCGLVLAIGVAIVIIIPAVIYCIKKTEPRQLVPPSPISSDSETSRPPTPSITPTSILSFVIPDSPPLPHTLVVYSNRTSDDDKQAIIVYLCQELAQYVHVHRLDIYDHITPAEWLQRWEQNVTKILCVCNREFWEDWERETAGSLVAALKVMVLAQVHANQKPSEKYIVVLLNSRDTQYIPGYLKLTHKCLLDETQDLAHYVTSVQEYQLE